MEDIRSVYLRHLEGRIRDIACELTRVRYTASQPATAWHPAINAYRCRDGVLICAELAGVNRGDIALTVEPNRVRLRGQRPPPEPRDTEGPLLQVLAMEFDHGFFERDIVLPVEVDPERVQAEHLDGVLWIHLPLATPTES